MSLLTYLAYSSYNTCLWVVTVLLEFWDSLLDLCLLSATAGLSYPVHYLTEVYCDDT